MPVAESYKGPGSLVEESLWEPSGTLTFTKGTFGPEEGCSDNESFNVSHEVQGDWTEPGGNFYRRCPVLSARHVWWSHGDCSRVQRFSLFSEGSSSNACRWI